MNAAVGLTWKHVGTGLLHNERFHCHTLIQFCRSYSKYLREVLDARLELEAFTVWKCCLSKRMWVPHPPLRIGFQVCVIFEKGRGALKLNLITPGRCRNSLRIVQIARRKTQSIRWGFPSSQHTCNESKHFLTQVPLFTRQKSQNDTLHC